MSKNINVTTEQVLDLQQNADGTYTVTAKDLDSLVSKFKMFLSQKKFRNLPNPSNKASMIEVSVTALDYTKKILYITQGLIEAGEITEDKYGFLTATVSTFNNWDKTINKEFIPKAKEILAKEEKALKDKEANATSKEEVKEAPLSAIEVATIVAEPTSEADSKVDVKTVKGQRFTFDKINYTLTYTSKDGQKTIKLVPEKSWRSTILKWLSKIVDWVVKQYNNVKDRCIGIKQTFQFWKIKRKMEKEMAKSEIDSLAISQDDLPKMA